MRVTTSVIYGADLVMWTLLKMFGLTPTQAGNDQKLLPSDDSSETQKR